MDKPRPCGCKGRRTCLKCEENYEIQQENFVLQPGADSFVYCQICALCYPGWDPDSVKNHPNHEGAPIKFNGIYVQSNFLTENEHDRLIRHIDSIPWDPSQSGRRKQNYGPKCNFKKRKLRMGEFRGFPEFSKFVQDKFETVPILDNFQTIEQCSLEYDPENGASIDPHVDDCWVWGERVVTVNLLSDSVLTLTYNNRPDKYNLDLVRTYPKILDRTGKIIKANHLKTPFEVTPIAQGENYPVIRVPMPKNSLLVMFNGARYDWEHRVLRGDVEKRRVCLAYREFTPPYLEGGGQWEEGKLVVERAKQFW